MFNSRYTPKSTHTRGENHKWPGVPLVDCQQQLTVGTNVYVCQNENAPILTCFVCKVRDLAPRGDSDPEDAFMVGLDYFKWPKKGSNSKKFYMLKDVDAAKVGYWHVNARVEVKGILKPAQVSESASGEGAATRRQTKYYRFPQVEHLLE